MEDSTSRTDHDLDHVDHIDHIDHTDHTDHIDHTDHTDHIDHIDHTDHISHLQYQVCPVSAVMRCCEESVSIEYRSNPGKKSLHHADRGAPTGYHELDHTHLPWNDLDHQVGIGVIGRKCVRGSR